MNVNTTFTISLPLLAVSLNPPSGGRDIHCMFKGLHRRLTLNRTNAPDREDTKTAGTWTISWLARLKFAHLLISSYWLSVHFSLLLEQYGFNRTCLKNKTKLHSVQKPDVDTQEVRHDSRKQLLNSLQMENKRQWRGCMILHSCRGETKEHSVYSTSPSSKVSVRGLHPDAMPGSGSVLSSVSSSAVTHWYLATQRWHQVPKEKHVQYIQPRPSTHTHTHKFNVPRRISWCEVGN